MPKEEFPSYGENETPQTEEITPKEEFTPPPVSPLPPFYPQESFQEPKPKSRIGLIIKIIMAVVILAAIGVGTSLATRIYDPLWNPFRPSPETVINKMSLKMKDIKTLHTDIMGWLNIASKSNYNETGFKMNVVLGIDSDNSEINNLKTAAKADLGLTINDSSMPLGVKFVLAGELKTLNEKLYLKLTTIPILAAIEAELSNMGIDINQIKNQWIRIDKDSMKNLMVKIFGDNLPPNFEQMLQESTQKQKELSEKIMKIFENKNFYSLKNEFPDEKINGKNYYHYAIVLSKQEIKNTIIEMLDIIGKEQGMTLDPETLAKGFDKFFEKVGDLEGELWINKKDYTLSRFKGEKYIDLSNILGLNDEKTNLFLNLDVNLSKFDEVVKIEAPADSKGIDEILVPMFEKSLSDAQSRARDARRQSDLYQIRSAMTVSYKNKYLQSSTMPKSIGSYLTQMPVDPGQGSCPGSYKWISNMSNPQKFCVYACLENGKFFAANEKSTLVLNSPPKNLDCFTTTNIESPIFYLGQKSQQYLEASLLGNLLNMLKK